VTESTPVAYSGTLYLVATPIGNMEDITLRALRILRTVSVIAAEDTRHTRQLLDRHNIQQQLISYFEHNEQARVGPILERLKASDVALVSEAGMPGISDPGYDLVRAAIDVGVRVIPIPGASAPIAALAASGLPTDQFTYLGFLPRRSSERRRVLADAGGEKRTLIAFESPHRLVDALEDIRDELGGDRPVVIARELTKIHEEFVRGTAHEALEHFRSHPPKGEVTLLIGSSPAVAPSIDLTERIRELLSEGRSAADVATTVAAEAGVPRRQVYRLLLGLKNYAKI
jgi:16S rRNA (cytidine1402-2'-O)-methyltransferase